MKVDSHKKNRKRTTMAFTKPIIAASAFFLAAQVACTAKPERKTLDYSYYSVAFQKVEGLLVSTCTKDGRGAGYQMNVEPDSSSSMALHMDTIAYLAQDIAD